MAAMNILVTGGAGFIGSHLVSELLKHGHSVTVLDSLIDQVHGGDSYASPEGVRFVLGSVCDFHLVKDLVSNIDVVFHLAAETGTGQSMYRIRKYVETNDLGTASVLEALVEVLARREVKFILSSSRSIYGEGMYRGASGEVVFPESRAKADLENGLFDFRGPKGEYLEPIPTSESAFPKPASIYASTKYSQEQLCLVHARAHSNFKLGILRFQNVYGAGQSLRNPYTGIISIFYNQMRQGKFINVFEDGREGRDFVYVTDVVDSLIGAMLCQEPFPFIANIGSGRLCSVLELVEKMGACLGVSPKFKVSGDFRLGDIRHNFADISMAQQLFNFSPNIALEQGLALFFEWASGQPEFLDQAEYAMQELRNRGLSG